MKLSLLLALVNPWGYKKAPREFGPFVLRVRVLVMSVAFSTPENSFSKTAPLQTVIETRLSSWALALNDPNTITKRTAIARTVTTKASFRRSFEAPFLTSSLRFCILLMSTEIVSVARILTLIKD